MKLRLESINKSLQNQVVLKQVSLSVKEGEFLTVFGPSGSGKSTLLKVITGLLQPEEGQVLLNEVEITQLATEARGISYVFQEPHLFPHLTVRGNIAFGLEIQKFSKKEIRERVEYLIKLMQLEELSERYPHQLSGGQKQRVSIARGLAPGPSLLLMDEPFSGLDQELREEMGVMMKKLQQQMKLTIIFVTHHRDECLRLSDSIVLMKDGRILQQGTVNQVYYNPINPEAAQLMGKGNWIHGQVQKEVFYSEFFEKNLPGEQDGKKDLFIRPHQIRIFPQKENKSSQEIFFQITSMRFMGKEFQIEVKRNNTSLLIETFDQGDFKVGDFVLVEFL